jgi:hypothetical protein
VVTSRWSLTTVSVTCRDEDEGQLQLRRRLDAHDGALLGEAAVHAGVQCADTVRRRQQLPADGCAFAREYRLSTQYPASPARASCIMFKCSTLNPEHRHGPPSPGASTRCSRRVRLQSPVASGRAPAQLLRSQFQRAHADRPSDRRSVHVAGCATRLEPLAGCLQSRGSQPYSTRAGTCRGASFAGSFPASFPLGSALGGLSLAGVSLPWKLPRASNRKHSFAHPEGLVCTR